MGEKPASELVHGDRIVVKGRPGYVLSAVRRAQRGHAVRGDRMMVTWQPAHVTYPWTFKVDCDEMVVLHDES